MSQADYSKIIDIIRAGGVPPYYGFNDEAAEIDQFRPVTPNIEVEYGWTE